MHVFSYSKAVSKLPFFVNYWRDKLLCQNDYKFSGSFFVLFILLKEKKKSKPNQLQEWHVKNWSLHVEACLHWTATCMFINNKKVVYWWSLTFWWQFWPCINQQMVSLSFQFICKDIFLQQGIFQLVNIGV